MSGEAVQRYWVTLGNLYDHPDDVDAEFRTEVMKASDYDALALRAAEVEGSFRCYYCDRNFTAEAAVQHFRGHEYKLAVTEEHVKQLKAERDALKQRLDDVLKAPEIVRPKRLVDDLRDAHRIHELERTVQALREALVLAEHVIQEARKYTPNQSENDPLSFALAAYDARTHHG